MMTPLKRTDDESDQPLMDEATFKRLGDLLGRFGLNKISRETFWSEMNKRGWGQTDIDRWLDEDCRRDAEKVEAERK